MARVLFRTNTMSDGSPRVRWTQSSMRNAFGLRLVHLFFNIPFLCLQRETLKLQIERNRQEIVSSYSELDCYRESAEADYEKFMEAVTQKRRQAAENQGVKPSAVTPSARVMGGGQPIPGQSLSPEKSVRKPSDVSLAGSADSAPTTVQKSSPEHFESRKDSFEMLGGEEVDDMNQFLDSSEMAEKSRRPASLPLQHSSISDDENNTMVRTFEEDFYADDDLKEKMSKKAVEQQKKTKKTTVLKLQELPPPSITPPAYHVRLESDNADSSNDEYITPERTDSDVPNTFTALSSPSEQKTLESIVTESNHHASTAFTAEDLDEWLGKEDVPAVPNEIEQPVVAESSDDEIGVKPPVLTPTQPTVTVPQTVQMVIPNLKTEEKPKKKKKKNVEGSTEKKKTKDGVVKPKKRSSSKPGRNSMKTPQVTLEEFLGGPIVQDDQDYDPL
ncbi:unnamed protein product [Auanema sp. JU1783]|nr:unnamed protein product [Auanema sp. JU1783]